MPPTTRSGGAPPQGRVYHSTPALHQTKFTAPRRKIRTYGKQDSAKKQQTLTQLNFVSTYFNDHNENDDESDLVPTDGEDNIAPSTTSKPRRKIKGTPAIVKHGEDEDEDEDEEPLSTGNKKRKRSSHTKRPVERASGTKRRRTLGDEESTDKKVKKGQNTSRRRTLGDQATSSSNYHTQTLTQFVGRRSTIQDSDAEGDSEGFQDWLGIAGSPSPQPKKGTSRSVSRRLVESSPIRPLSRRGKSLREDSIVPQTPPRRMQFEIPSSSQNTTPVSSLAKRYGHPNRQEMSPLQPRSANIRILPSSSSKMAGKLKAIRGQDAHVDKSPGNKKAPIKRQVTPQVVSSPEEAPLAVVPTSSPLSSILSMSSGSFRQNKNEMSEPASEHHTQPTTSLQGEATTQVPKPAAAIKTVTVADPREIPDSDEDDDLDEEDSAPAPNSSPYRAGPETQIILQDLASSEEDPSQLPKVVDKSSPIPELHRHLRGTSVPTTSVIPERRVKPLRKPLKHPVILATQIDGAESQRVPAAVLQEFPTASMTSDALMRVDKATLSAIVEGFEDCISLSFKFHNKTVRVWFRENDEVSFVACLEPVTRITNGWSYRLSQLYQLNNPVTREELLDEHLLKGKETRFCYLPPGIVGRWLWNLRHAIFADDGVMDCPIDPPAIVSERIVSLERQGSGLSTTLSQQLEQQLHSESTHYLGSDAILVPSTPDEEVTPKTTFPVAAKSSQTAIGARKAPLPTPITAQTSRATERIETPTRASQATTVSQRSSPGSIVNTQRRSRTRFVTTDTPKLSFASKRNRNHSQDSSRNNATIHRDTDLYAQIQPIPARNLDRDHSGDSTSSSTRETAKRHSSHSDTPLSLLPPPLPNSSSSLKFIDCSESPITIPQSIQLQLDSSQLLTNSQLLSESLLRDDVEGPPCVDISDDG